ncbi:hypothetical protein QAD02_007519 [Eretmocerus hayati]|uniref:Uncharacterized protein n=1 Tax=Eretmocerus hayati TaxID=131215 RepID=A0ACC2N485_9HYME|nr:hypothetical protein QAD02_007519 [Eretmocerus hayati]
MGECMDIQQALLHIPIHDGKILPLKTFIQDVENGFAIRPEGIRSAFLKGVIAKLRDTARDAVSGTEIDSIDTLRNALKEYFASKKTYSQYCAEFQGVRMRKSETVMEYFTRIKRSIEGAKACIEEKFNNQQVPHMITMLEGIATGSSKRGLSDDLLYAVSVKERESLDAAVKIAQRIGNDIMNASERKGLLKCAIASPTFSPQMQRRVQFSDEFPRRKRTESDSLTIWKKPTDSDARDKSDEQSENTTRIYDQWRTHPSGPRRNY